MKSGIYYTRRVIQANSNVFWTYELSSNVSDYDEQNPVGSYQYWEGGELYGWYDSRDRDRERIWQDSEESSEKIDKKLFVYKTRKVQVENQGSRLLMSSNRTGGIMMEEKKIKDILD